MTNTQKQTTRIHDLTYLTGAARSATKIKKIDKCSHCHYLKFMPGAQRPVEAVLESPLDGSAEKIG